jgi:AraC-like DNA-binding protein
MSLLFTVYDPSPALRPFVHSYAHSVSLAPCAAPPRLAGEGGSAFVLPPGDPMADRLFPSACVFLNFNLGDPVALARRDGDMPLPEGAHVLGPVTRPGRMRLPQRVEALCVGFQPGYAHHFLRTRADELTDELLALEHFWGADGRMLQERLLQAPTVREKICLVEAELLRRLASASPPDRMVPAIADLVLRCQGVTTVAALSAASGFTRQHLARKFRHSLGVSPKLFCRLVRFQSALTRVLLSPPDNWAAAAVDLGYYDQSHLIAELKEFTGYTPTGILAARPGPVVAS